MKPVVFLNSHPIQYFAPLYRQISETTDIDLTVWYCSDESIKGGIDKGFSSHVKWDIPLLEGYKYIFLKNYSWKKSIYKGFWGLVNPGVIRKLFHQPRSVIIVHGWAYSTHILTIIFGKIFGHTVCLRAETPFNQELMKNRMITSVKNIWLRFLFLFVDRFLIIGKQNRLFFESLAVKQDKILPVLYSVDNDRFRKLFNDISKEEARKSLALPHSAFIILYSGKYIAKKRPMDLLQAFHALNVENAILIFVGEGGLRNEMEKFISDHGLLNNVKLTGFINQSQIPVYYRAADCFVMCSGPGETWGLSVNEAMNFGIPIIISDTCGCAVDLIENDINGSIFETGNIGELSALLKKYMEMPEETRNSFGDAGFKKIDQYSYGQNIGQLKILAKCM